ncbi:MAG: hypothetical protein LBN20_03185, partial [Endomicrobium sp.]|nr:hypothetical protein [Endomicrobium sp.]
MKENTIILKHIEKTMRKRLSQAFFLLFLFIFSNTMAQAVNVSSFSYLQSLFPAGADIQLLNSIDYNGNISTLTAVSTIRGSTYSVIALQGRKNFNGFTIGAGGTANFTNNINLANFKAQRDILFANRLYGGAIYVSRQNSKINFIDAFANLSFNMADYGAAIAVSSLAIANISNSTLSFSNNSASNFGGAIYVNLSSTLSFTRTNLTFSNNSAQDRGGAVYIGSYSWLNFINSTSSFNSNRAGSGAVFYIERSSMNINSSFLDFKTNKVTSIGQG